MLEKLSQVGKFLDIDPSRLVLQKKVTPVRNIRSCFLDSDVLASNAEQPENVERIVH